MITNRTVNDFGYPDSSYILVMGPGGYRFGDYRRLGLPLEILIIATAIPLIALIWPL